MTFKWPLIVTQDPRSWCTFINLLFSVGSKTQFVSELHMCKSLVHVVHPHCSTFCFLIFCLACVWKWKLWSEQLLSWKPSSHNVWIWIGQNVACTTACAVKKCKYRCVQLFLVYLIRIHHQNRIVTFSQSSALCWTRVRSLCRCKLLQTLSLMCVKLFMSCKWIYFGINYFQH